MKKFLTTAAVAASVAFGGAAAANAGCDANEILDDGSWAMVVEHEDNVFWTWMSNDYVTGQIGDIYEVGSDDFYRIGMALAIHNVCFGVGSHTSHIEAPSYWDAPEAVGDSTFVGYQVVVESSNVLTLD